MYAPLTLRPQATRLDLHLTKSEIRDGEMRCHATVIKGELVNGLHVMECQLFPGSLKVPVYLVLTVSSNPSDNRARIIPTEDTKFRTLPLLDGEVEIAVQNHRANPDSIIMNSPRSEVRKALQKAR